MRLAVVTLSDSNNNLRDVIVRNFDGVTAPKGDKHVARFMRKHDLKVTALYFSPVRATFDDCFDAIIANRSFYRN